VRAWHAGRMGTAVILVVKGRNGRIYPARKPTEAEFDRIVDLTHRIRCGQGLSQRATVEKLAEHGIRRSKGTVSHILRAYVCDLCRDQP